jgi:hypothetical protein
MCPLTARVGGDFAPLLLPYQHRDQLNRDFEEYQKESSAAGPVGESAVGQPTHLPAEIMAL